MTTPPPIRVGASVITLACLMFSALSLLGQNGGNFRPGQRIQWLDGITGKWQKGEYVDQTPGGKQPIIRKTPGDINSQMASSWDAIKAGGDDDTAAPAKPAPPMANPAAPKPATPDTPAKPAITPGGGQLPPVGAPLTEDEIKTFITDRIGDTPFADTAKLQQTKNELGELIKKRGVAFRYDSSISPMGNWLSAHGMTSEVMGPLSHNFGPPNAQQWLFGQWVTSKVGLPVKYVDGDKLMLWTEAAQNNTGFVTINPDGSYRWDTKSAQGVIQGKWREANATEMADQGGAGVVLEGAKNGENWVAFKYRMGNPNEEWLGLAEVNHRSIREGAMRVGGK